MALALLQVTPTVIKSMRQVIQAYRPPIALVCLEAMCLIIYEKPPTDQHEAGPHSSSSTIPSTP